MRNRARKTEKKDLESLKRAASIVLLEKRSARSVATDFDDVKHGTLNRLVNKLKKFGPMNDAEEVWQALEQVNVGYAKRRVFTEEQERQMAEYIKLGESPGVPSTEIRKLAFECAQGFEMKIPESWKEKKMAGPDWYSGFIKRNTGKGAVRDCSTEYPHPMDWAQMECARSTKTSEKMTEQESLLSMQNFIDDVRPCKTQPVLLLLDNHKFYLSDKVLNLSKDNGVMLSFLPHTSLKTVSVYDRANLDKESLQTSSTNNTSAFRKCGVMSFQREDNVFAQAGATDVECTSRPAFQSTTTSHDSSTVTTSIDYVNNKTTALSTFSASTSSVREENPESSLLEVLAVKTLQYWDKINTKKQKNKLMKTIESDNELDDQAIKKETSSESPAKKQCTQSCLACNENYKQGEKAVECSLCIDWTNEYADGDNNYICPCHICDNDDDDVVDDDVDDDDDDDVDDDVDDDDDDENINSIQG